MSNEFVEENEDCSDRVAGALNWIICSVHHDQFNVPRPHSPRSSLERDVIAIAVFISDDPTCFYLPATKKWFRLPAIKIKASVKHIVSFRKTLLVVTDYDITRSQCYDPDLNRWSPAPWIKLDSKLPFNEAKLIVVDRDVTALWRYNFDSNSLSPLLK